MYGSIFYSDVPAKAKTVKGIDGAAITQMNLDKTHILNCLIDNLPEKNPLQIIGELQFAFITFVLGENFESFEQWKSLIILLCGCRWAMVSQRNLYFRLIPVLYNIVEQLPVEFFAENNEDCGISSIANDNNFIKKAMSDLILTSLEHPGVPSQIC